MPDQQTSSEYLFWQIFVKEHNRLPKHVYRNKAKAVRKASELADTIGKKVYIMQMIGHIEPNHRP